MGAQVAKQAGRKRKKRVTLADSPWDHGANGPANRKGLVVEDRGEIDSKTGKRVNPNGVTGVRRRDMLEIYHKRGWISTAGYNAGEMLRLAWLRTEMGACSPWLRERVDSSLRPHENIDIQIDRMSALISVGQLVHVDDRRVVDIVCRHGAAIGSLPEYRGRRHEEGKLHLRDALERLADRIEGVARKFRVA